MQPIADFFVMPALSKLPIQQMLVAMRVQHPGSSVGVIVRFSLTEIVRLHADSWGDALTAETLYRLADELVGKSGSGSE